MVRVMCRARKLIKALTLALAVLLPVCSALPALAVITVAPGQIMFVIDGRASDDIHADKTVFITRKGNNGNGHSNPIYYWATDLADSHGHTITADMLYALTPYDSAWQRLDNSVLFLADNEAGAEIRFKLAKEARGYKGVYKGWLRSSEGRNRDIRVIVHIKSYFNLILDGGAFLVVAPTPGMHEAESPVTLTVNSNHDQWLITVGLDGGLTYSRDKPGDIPRIRPENLFLSIDGKDFKPLTQTQIISGGKYGSSASIKLRLRARTEWQHIAGTYSGKMSLIVSESCGNEEEFIDDEQFFDTRW